MVRDAVNPRVRIHPLHVSHLIDVGSLLYRTQDWETYLSSMLGIGAVDGASPNVGTVVNPGVDGMGTFL